MRHLRMLLALVAILAGGAVADDEKPDPAIALLKREVAAVREADWIVVGSVEKVHGSPGVWCGVVVTRQDVTFRVVETIAGKAAGPTVRAGFLLVASPFIQKDKPEVRPELFGKGARFLLCLKKDGDHWRLPDEVYSARALRE